MLNVNFETIETTLISFDRIANSISNNTYLKINNAFYRIIDFEFYTFSQAFPDPHTYKNHLQLQSGKLYLHSSGIDITFGDDINYGGILLRSVVKLNKNGEKDKGLIKKQYDGPQNVATELFSNLNSLFNSDKNDISIVELSEQHQDGSFYPAKKVIKTKRVGLTPKPNDVDDYYRNLPLRYVAILPKFSNFKQVLKGIEDILTEQVLKEKMSIEEAQEILGYKKRF